MAHWYVVGASPERLNEIRGLNHLVDVIEGPVDQDGQSGLWRKLSLAAPDGLWIRWEALEPPEWAGLRRLRVAQPSLPIFVEIPSDWAPPNPDLAQLVGLGIYGIVSESASFVTATSRIFTYADAAHWQGDAGLSWDDVTEGQAAKPKRRRKRTDLPQAAQADTETLKQPLTREQQQRLLRIDRSIDQWLEKTATELQAIRQERQRLAGIPQDVGPSAF